jgi:hypothetical protein
MTDWSHTLRFPLLNRPRLFVDFESLSPIKFQDINEFTSKLNKYKPKYRKGRQTVLDNSPANVTYSLTEQLSGPVRGAFEHGR